MLPEDYKDIYNLNTFKNKIKKWKPENCPCRLCKVYIDNKGFVWEQKRNLEYSVASGEVFLLLASIVLLQARASFLNLFNTFCFAIGFHDFYILVDHVETSQLIPNNNWLTGFCMGYGNAKSVSLDGFTDRVYWKFNSIFFYFVFYNKCIFRWLIFLWVVDLNQHLYCNTNFIVYGSFSLFSQL